MDNFQKIATVFAGRPAGELLWYLDFSPAWILNRPAHIQTWIDVASDLGCIWPKTFYPALDETFDSTVRYETFTEDDQTVKQWHTPIGSLRMRMTRNHPVEHSVKTANDCRTLQYIYEHTHTRLNTMPDEAFHSASTLTSPVQQLLQYEMGLENFYTLLVMEQETVEQLMAAMQKKQMERTALACQVDVPVIYQGENTSTTMISPAYYEKYSLPQIKTQVDYVHAHGKKMILHMCGLLGGLLGLLKQTGIDGIHSLTPPPVGDTPFEPTWNIMGPRLSVQGRFGSTQWFGLSEKEIVANLAAIMPKGLWNHYPFILLVTLDSVEVEYEELKRLSHIIRAYGR